MATETDKSDRPDLLTRRGGVTVEEAEDLIGVNPMLLSRVARLTPNFRLTIQLVLAARRWRALLDERLRPIGQSAARMEAMSTIAHSPPFSPQIAIAKRIGIEGATLTRMVDALETDGFVERLAHPTDRRTKHIRLTPAGHRALLQINAIANDLRNHLLHSFDDGAIETGNNFLAALLDRLDEDFPTTSGDEALDEG